MAVAARGVKAAEAGDGVRRRRSLCNRGHSGRDEGGRTNSAQLGMGFHVG